MKTDITLRVKYTCGCERVIRTLADIPKNLADAERTEENDAKTIEYLNNNYDLSRLHCENRHKYAPGSFEKIIEII